MDDSPVSAMKSYFSQKLSRKDYIISFIKIAVIFGILIFLSGYLAENNYAAHMQYELSVWLYMISIGLWAMCSFATIYYLIMKTAYRFNDVGLYGWLISIFIYLCSVLPNYFSEKIIMYSPLISLIGIILAFILPGGKNHNKE
ncbi:MULTISPECIES: DUF805 domain-containing protein [Photorhabdus]|uniref:Photorhabdus luminescens subsp. laumondii TTO1 complete genome segment 10/17 n=1 Tax=Photorhabdus laumondii subsp. laumondii (strain DSM 15139 / CIP 105565 / TT01) TaxID=243265 RepID=Q7N3C8_PHOLL|nr:MULTISPECIES: DUF805 domain-containing protein [Photorhabdus]AWK42511.1 hypothetical protein A4R40_13905 [Photorhabdus laumondii subsp. laumondii]AXG43360.1 DUF805 domain-containing protein [Photorhabdus laumondii subsp. laumondii]AXG47832.1 DUF805 domain-containing protein [Photorhabdus laumondii subsp. laumondii]MCC8390195.1 DUF805 domain-containing protein [Photorhabdus laumondii]MCZ1250325.1 DUF805 domain-containing protein [Photorhabdus laumondii subsp. laumondii]